MTFESPSVRISRDREELLDELSLYLVAPGQGVYAVSTGKAELLALTRRYLGGAWDEAAPWREGIARALEGRTALFAIPSDTGAGIVRGAARGPEAIRAELGTAPVHDLGDVFTNPHLLDDAMLARPQIEACQDAVYAKVDIPLRRTLPVSPLSVASRVLEIVSIINPALKLMMLGGDHTVTWPVIAHHLKRETRLTEFGVLHFDAHTDLSVNRLGVAICFATWAHHVNQLLGGGQRLLQVGIRASQRKREYWEATEQVRQIWASDARTLGAERLAEVVVAHFEAKGVRRVYVTNDIDGTDAAYAAACGTPEPDGLLPEMVLAVLARLGESAIEVVGADLVELAPGLSLDREASALSVRTAASYVRASLELLR